MYAVVSTGGKQYRVEPGATLSIEKLAVEPGATVTFDRVLLVGDGDETTVGTPTVSGATVSATVLGEELGPKLVIFKFKQKVKYRRRTGHRQHLTRVRIDEISAGGQRTRSAEEPAAKPKRTRASAETSNESASEPGAAPPRKPRRAKASADAKGEAAAEAATKRTATRATRARTKRTKRPAEE